MSDEHTKVAIACQGGGSHTAFTAEALQRLLPEIACPEYKLVGFSGTSGGAIYALLGEFWNDLKATTVTERLVNDFAVGLTELRAMCVGLSQCSQTQTPAGMLAQRELRSLLERHVDFERVRALSDTIRERRRIEGAVFPAMLA